MKGTGKQQGMALDNRMTFGECEAILSDGMGLLMSFIPAEHIVDNL